MEEPDFLEKFRAQVVFWITSAATVVGLPFLVNHIVHQRWLSSLVSVLMLGLLAVQSLWLYMGRKPPLDVVYLVPAAAAFLTTVFQKQGIIGALWSYPVIVLFYFLLPARQARWANLFLGVVVVISAFEELPWSLATRVLATVTLASLASVIFIYVIGIQQKQLRDLALIDPLTGVHNRLQLDLCLRRAALQNQRHKVPASLVAIDIDHFKKINDSLGHAAGDEVLRRVGALLRNRLRAVDLVFRTGGEEFLVLLDHTDLEQARGVAEELKARIAEAQVLPGRTVTVSIGVAELQSREEVRDWVKRSDDQLYRAKRNGRNQVAWSPRPLADRPSIEVSTR